VGGLDSGDVGEAVGGMVSVSRGCCCSSRPPPPGEAGGAPDTSPSQRDLGRLLMPPVSPSHLSPICSLITVIRRRRPP
jgi:hypothetical protein